jgi:hypothetical protein
MSSLQKMLIAGGLAGFVVITVITNVIGALHSNAGGN